MTNPFHSPRVPPDPPERPPVDWLWRLDVAARLGLAVLLFGQIPGCVLEYVRLELAR